MRVALVIMLVSLLGAGSAAAAGDISPADFPTLPAHAASPQGFVPAGWRLERTVSGDLNADGRADHVLILREDNPRKVIDGRPQGGPEHFDTNPRMLAVVFASATQGYDLILENHTLIPQTTDPTQQDALDPDGVQPGGVEIKKGTLRVTLGYFGGDMGRITYTFRFKSGRFRLIGYDSIDVARSRGTTEDISVNYSTGRLKRSTGTISSDAEHVTWTTLPHRPLLSIDQIGDGSMFDPTSH